MVLLSILKSPWILQHHCLCGILLTLCFVDSQGQGFWASSRKTAITLALELVDFTPTPWAVRKTGPALGEEGED